MAEGFIRERGQALQPLTMATPSILKPQSTEEAARHSMDSERITVPAESGIPVTEQGGQAATSPTIKEALAAFVGERSPKWKSVATQMDQPKRLQTFLDIIGPEMTFAEFSRNRDAIRRYFTVMTTIPTDYSKKAEYRELDWDALVALNVPQHLRFRRETLKNNFNTVRGFLSWAEDEGYLSGARRFNKVLVDLPEQVEESQKRGFTGEELSRLFAPESFMTRKTGLDRERPWKFLVPLLALFTGARIEELCQLELADIQFEAAAEGNGEGIHYIHITDASNNEGKETGSKKSVKTKAGIRKVPLHPFLMGQDGSPVSLLDYVSQLRSKGETRLFPMLIPNSRGNYSDAVTKWFTRYRRDCGIGGGKGECSDVTFHSFRHTVVTTSMIKDVDRRKVKQMVGHEDSLIDARDITARYEGDYPLSIIARDVVGVLDFDRTLGLYEALAAWREVQQS